MNESRDREIVREALASVAAVLHIERGRPIKEVKQLIREVVLTDY